MWLHVVAAVLVLGFAKMDIWDPFNKVAKHGLEYCANGARQLESPGEGTVSWDCRV